MLRLLLIAAAAATATLAAQAPPQFRSRVDLVHLDVSVLDQNRRPVKGLTAADFTVVEDGKPQVITAFDAIDLPDPAPPTTPWMRTVSPDVRRNTDTAERRLIAIVMDDANIPFDIAMLKSAREIGRLVVDRLGPNDLASVIFTRDNRNAQEFTNDKARLLRAVESFDVGSRVIGLSTGEGQGVLLSQMHQFEVSVGVLTRIAQSLAAVSHRRKSVVYVGVGLPAGNAPGDITLIAPGGDRGVQEVDAVMRQLKHLLMDTYRQARLANVNFYAVSPAGVGGMAAFIEAERHKQKKVPAYETGGNYLDFLLGLADNTGGRAFPERNEFASALDQVFLENGSYYLVGYSPPNPADDGKYRRLEVKVNRPGVTVRTRNGYYNDKPAAVKAAAEASPLETALAGLLPKTDVDLEVAAAPFLQARGQGSGAVVVLRVRDEAGPRPNRTNEKVDLQISAFTPEGAARGTTRYETEVTLRPGPAGPIEYEVLSSVPLRPGRYQLRLSAHIGSKGRSGSVYYDVDIPDFSGEPVSLSGVLLTSDQRPVSSDNARIRDYVSTLPTAKRSFTSGERVSAFARVHQSMRSQPAAVNVSITVVDAAGIARLKQALAIPAPAIGAGDRSADVSVEIPVKTLPPGPYVLTFDAMSSRGSARRSVRFEVR